MKRDPHELVPEGRYVEFIRDEREHDTERFDRLAYAARILRLLAPRDLTVALCPGTERLTVREGREHAPGRPPRWAMVAIPPDASRVHIALALARLTGRHEEPYLIDVLTRAPALRG
ncbi:MAG TPA: hypothetical protein VFS43_48200 [Polyangiaceae bacterium]|nr:hypothetical protein [Polyangiaceae bacterium]